MPRSEERKSLAMEALVKVSGDRVFSRRRYKVGLSDISCRGCRIVTSGNPFNFGQHLILKPDGLEGIGCTVRWVSFEFAGVEFDHALHPAVVEHLCRLHPDQRENTSADLNLSGER